MGRLIVKEYGRDTREFMIPADAAVEIGRDAGAEIVLRDVAVSRAHARIWRQENAFFIEDLGSSNGTVVNEKKLPRKGARELHHGDRVRLGRSLLRLILRLTRRITTRVKGGQRANAAPGSAVRAPPAPERSAGLFRLQKLRASLLVAQAGGRSQRYVLESDRIRIGRDPASDIVFDDPHVSGDHAEIVYNSEGFHLVDRGSAVGTLLDGVAIRVARLHHQSFLKIGPRKILFVIHGPGAGPSEVSFALRDRLCDLHPERAKQMQSVFRDSRESGRDFAEDLVELGILDPEEWWAATREIRETRRRRASGWFERLLRRRRRR